MGIGFLGTDRPGWPIPEKEHEEGQRILREVPTDLRDIVLTPEEEALFDEEFVRSVRDATTAKVQKLEEERERRGLCEAAEADPDVNHPSDGFRTFRETVAETLPRARAYSRAGVFIS